MNSGGTPTAAGWSTFASRPLTPAAVSTATWPSPRCSRSSVAACHSTPNGSSGQAGRRWRRTAPGPPAAPTRRPGEPARRRRRRRRRRRATAAARRPSRRRALEGGVGRGEGPGVGERPGDPRRGEVVEQRRHDAGPDGAERRGPPGEVAHPEALVAGVAAGRRPAPGRSR